MVGKKDFGKQRAFIYMFTLSDLLCFFSHCCPLSHLLIFTDFITSFALTHCSHFLSCFLEGRRVLRKATKMLCDFCCALSHKMVGDDWETSFA